MDHTDKLIRQSNPTDQIEGQLNFSETPSGFLIPRGTRGWIIAVGENIFVLLSCLFAGIFINHLSTANYGFLQSQNGGKPVYWLIVGLLSVTGVALSIYALVRIFTRHWVCASGIECRLGRWRKLIPWNRIHQMKFTRVLTLQVGRHRVLIPMSDNFLETQADHLRELWTRSRETRQVTPIVNYGWLGISGGEYIVLGLAGLMIGIGLWGTLDSEELIRSRLIVCSSAVSLLALFHGLRVGLTRVFMDAQGLHQRRLFRYKTLHWKDVVYAGFSERAQFFTKEYKRIGIIRIQSLKTAWRLRVRTETLELLQNEIPQRTSHAVIFDETADTLHVPEVSDTTQLKTRLQEIAWRTRFSLKFWGVVNIVLGICVATALAYFCITFWKIPGISGIFRSILFLVALIFLPWLIFSTSLHRFRQARTISRTFQNVFDKLSN